MPRTLLARSLVRLGSKSKCLARNNKSRTGASGQKREIRQPGLIGWVHAGGGDAALPIGALLCLVAAAIGHLSRQPPADPQCFRPRLPLESYVRPKNYMLRFEPDQIR